MRKLLTTRLARLEALAGVGQSAPLLVISRHDMGDDDVIGCSQYNDPPVDRQPGESVSDLIERARGGRNPSALLFLHYREDPSTAGSPIRPSTVRAERADVQRGTSNGGFRLTPVSRLRASQ
jgi:hypothetical protein